MIPESPSAAAAAAIARRTDELFEEQRQAVYRRTDRMFAYLMVAQWLFGIVVALVFSPYGWSGKTRSVHLHVWVAIFLGGAISSLPVALALLRPGAAMTRNVVAVGQMLWSALLIHLTGGRIESHFHVFGSLAFLAFYRDWRVLVPATIVVATDHFLRGMFWPESVYGILFPEWWRFLAHAFWVAFEDLFLAMACIQAVDEMRAVARRRAEIEALSESEQHKSQALDDAMRELKGSHELLIRTEKLAAVGQLAASVGHELRNPLAAVRTASTYIRKKLGDGSAAGDPRVPQFIGVIEREVEACSKIIADLLDFARERPVVAAPCPLAPLVDEAAGLVATPSNARMVNAVPHDLPVPDLDREQFRQVLINLIQNAVEAIPAERAGQVTVRARGGGTDAWHIEVEDDGVGIDPDVVGRIFAPLFTTKTKGTGLGLAIVANGVKRHDGTIEVDSEPGRGTRFTIELPPRSAAQAA
jgi:signal transduction histidine kinase